MKPILKFPKIIILGLLLVVGGRGASPDYEPAEDEYEEGVVWPREGRGMYLAQGVEFVFPIGVQYTLANLNEQLWPLHTTGFDGVLEFPQNKIALMFSSMVNTLKIANFTVMSNIYTPDDKAPTTALRILGTELQGAEFRAGYKDTWRRMNADVSKATGGAVEEFVPHGGLYGRTIYPFTRAAYINSLHYENQWAFPWVDSPLDKFTDSPQVPFMEVEGLMPYYENDAFLAVAALFKSGTGSVVFLKPKDPITILQLMLNPTALTQIFDENFPGWGVKQMRVRVPQAAFTTNTQHFDMLVKRGVSQSFCVHESPAGEGKERFSLNPIVQTNHLRLAKDKMTIASVTGVTLSQVGDLKEWDSRQRDDMAPETLLEEYTTPKGAEEQEEEEVSTLGGEAQEDQVATTTEEGAAEERSDLASLSLANTSSSSSSSAEKEVKGGSAELYEFNEPFLWFLHAINEEPMFMGVVESFRRYLEETGDKGNGGGSSPSAASSVADKNGWIYEAAKGVLWHCPSMINKQAE